MSVNPTAIERMVWAVRWFDDSPRGATWGVASIDEVLCYTNPSEQGWADAQRISNAVSCFCYPDPRDHEDECLIRQTNGRTEGGS